VELVVFLGRLALHCTKLTKKGDPEPPKTSRGAVAEAERTVEALVSYSFLS
jgi:hypothetical protein